MGHARRPRSPKGPRPLQAFLIGSFLIAAIGGAPPAQAISDVDPAGAPAVRTLVELPGGALASLPADARQGKTHSRLIVLLHGAGQGPVEILDRFARDPACADTVLLAPKSAGATWDVVAMSEQRALMHSTLDSGTLPYGGSRDADRTIAAMTAIEAKADIDPGRTILVGFSDGASFALALGTARDRPFAGVVAIAPGLTVTPMRPARGREVVIVHGRRDRSLPFEFSRSTIAPALRDVGLKVRFVAFDGGHDIPANIMEFIGESFPTE